MAVIGALEAETPGKEKSAEETVATIAPRTTTETKQLAQSPKGDTIMKGENQGDPDLGTDTVANIPGIVTTALLWLDRPRKKDEQ